MRLPQRLRAPLKAAAGVLRRARGAWRERRWSSLSQADYEDAFRRLGGSFAVHPRVLALFEALSGERLRYLGLPDGGRLLAAIPVWDGEVALSKWALERNGLQDLLDLGDGELLLPLAPGAEVELPCAARMLSALHAGEIRGARREDARLTFARPHAAGADRLSGAFLKRRRSELRQFHEAGGREQPMGELDGAAVAGLYRTLFQRRWGRPPVGAAQLDRVFSGLFDLLAGHVLWHGPTPVGLHVTFCHETPRGLLAVGVNGAVDPAFGRFSPGGLLYYLNVAALEQRAAAAGKPLRYCFGRADAEYKKLWCVEQDACRVD